MCATYTHIWSQIRTSTTLEPSDALEFHDARATQTSKFRYSDICVWTIFLLSVSNPILYLLPLFLCLGVSLCAFHGGRALSNGTHLATNATTTRRSLVMRRTYRGGCVATNSIDSCWRCDPNWHLNRKKLAQCALGFGHGTTGGMAGKFYVVTDPSDNDVTNPRPGTLRHAVIQKVFRNFETRMIAPIRV